MVRRGTQEGLWRTLWGTTPLSRAGSWRWTISSPSSPRLPVLVERINTLPAWICTPQHAALCFPKQSRSVSLASQSASNGGKLTTGRTFTWFLKTVCRLRSQILDPLPPPLVLKVICYSNSTVLSLSLFVLSLPISISSTLAPSCLFLILPLQREL